MSWILNDAQEHQKGANCALVAAAALRSHATGVRTTSGEVMKDLWRIAAEDTLTATQTLEFLSETTPGEMDQSPAAVERWLSMRGELGNPDARNYQDIDRYRRTYAGRKGVDPFLPPPRVDYDGANAARAGSPLDSINSAEFSMMQEIAARAPGTFVSKRGLTAYQVLALLEEISWNSIFALHSYSLGHWIFGYVSADLKKPASPNPWRDFGIDVRFVDYQPLVPRWSRFPFLGVQPTPGQLKPECEIVVVRRPVSAVGLPELSHAGPVAKEFQDLAAGKGVPARKSLGAAMKAYAAQDPALQAHTDWIG